MQKIYDYIAEGQRNHPDPDEEEEEDEEDEMDGILLHLLYLYFSEMQNIHF